MTTSRILLKEELEAYLCLEQNSFPEDVLTQPTSTGDDSLKHIFVENDSFFMNNFLSPSTLRHEPFSRARTPRI